MNRLAQEKSPYLLQHAHNPVDWYPWGLEAFEKAKKEDKPIFLSIGYSTCHWCHVMERESFENTEIAKFMNAHFINIKVDREERPDVDHIYMTAVQAMTGGGGWPMSVFLTPALEPFFGGTYFPPDRRWGRPSFLDVLSEIDRMWKAERGKVADWGSQLSQAMKERRPAGDSAELSEKTLDLALQHFNDAFDETYGGFGGAPKFPRSESLSLLLRIHRRTNDPHALSIVTKTLESLARGGIYDQVGGGFHRYSTDAKWLVPHFEKMLYDNALLAKTYLEAFQVTKNEMFAGVAREILDYVLRDMTSPEGGFYSAEDADSEGVEGKFYVWTEEELGSILTPAEFQKVKAAFQVESQGNFEKHTILTFDAAMDWQTRYEEPLRSAIRKIFDHRKKRIPPYKDDKILTSWNALMISAMALAAQVLNDDIYRKAAQKAARFLLEKLYDGRSLKRRYREGEARFDASLDDYAFLIQALLDLYETDFDEEWIRSSFELQKKTDELFWDDIDGAYFLTDEHDPSLIARMKEIYDGAVPSGNSIAALNLLRFYAFTHDEAYRKKYDFLTRHFSAFANKNPQATPAFLMAVDFAIDPAAHEIVLAGHAKDPISENILQEIHRTFLPNKVLALYRLDSVLPLVQGKIDVNGHPTFYLCSGHACHEPLTDLGKIKAVLSE